MSFGRRIAASFASAQPKTLSPVAPVPLPAIVAARSGAATSFARDAVRALNQPSTVESLGYDGASVARVPVMPAMTAGSGPLVLEAMTATHEMPENFVSVAVGIVLGTVGLSFVDMSPTACITDRQEKRLNVCRRLTHPDNAHSAKYWCEDVGIGHKSFSDSKWCARYKAGGTPAVVKDAPRRKRVSLTPRTKNVILEAVEKDRKSAPAIIKRLLGEYQQRGEQNRAAPARSTINGFVHLETTGRVKLSRSKRIMVKTPWDARYRKHFAQEHKGDDPKKFVYSDEKIFAVFDIKGGDAGKTNLVFDGDELNVAKGKTDAEYLQWLEDNPRSKLPKQKSHGLYKVIVWGAVGYNTKSELFIFPQGTNLTNDLYHNTILPDYAKPLKFRPPAVETPTPAPPAAPRTSYLSRTTILSTTTSILARGLTRTAFYDSSQSSVTQPASPMSGAKTQEARGQTSPDSHRSQHTLQT
jgi:hypothetical protein